MHLQKVLFGLWLTFCTVATLHSLRTTSEDQYEVFHIYYQPLCVLIAMQWLWFVNVRYFELHNLRYDLCFSSYDQRYLLSSRQIFQVRQTQHCSQRQSHYVSLLPPTASRLHFCRPTWSALLRYDPCKVHAVMPAKLFLGMFWQHNGKKVQCRWLA